MIHRDMEELLIDNQNSSNLNEDTLKLDQCNDSRQHILFQLANVCFLLSFLATNGRTGMLFMRASLIVGFLLFSTFAWNVICAPGVFSWSFSFMITNFAQTLYLLYSMREVEFPSKEMEDAYEALFEPMKIKRILFKKLISSEYSCQIGTLHAGEAYAMQGLTRTDRLGLLLCGRVNVISGNHYLHSIESKQFLDSPEFESSKLGMEDKFRVSIIASTPSRYIYWQRTTLEYLLIKETYLAHVLGLLLARDITNKLYAMNEKIVTEKGSHLDIRLPSITTSLCNSMSSIHSDDQDIRKHASPIKPHLGLRIKDRHINSQIIKPSTAKNRSKSLPQNSLFAVNNGNHRVILKSVREKNSDSEDLGNSAESDNSFSSNINPVKQN